MKGAILAGGSALALMVASGALAAQSTTPSNASPTQRAQQSTTMQSQGEPRGEVKEAQQKLKSDNLYKGSVDGILGPETQQALKEFQKKNNLQQTGRLDDQTEQKLGVAEQSGSSMPPTTKKQ
jgi:peptidoglycan hydrolase-like protein with peptidoglycan-binding domain